MASTCQKARHLLGLAVVGRAVRPWHAARAAWSSNTWTESVAQAQQLVGSPTSLASFRSLLGDEMATLSGYAKRLMGSCHPFLHTARNFLLSDGCNQQFRGLTVLLLSKALATVGKPDSSSADPILPKQRALAEICELIHAATLMHGCTANMSQTDRTMRGPNDDFLFANKMSVLGGDFLLASACTALGRLHNVTVVHGMSQAIGEIMEGLFLRSSLANARAPHPVSSTLSLAALNDTATSAHPAAGSPATDPSLTTWAASTRRLGGALLGQSCRSVALLAGLPEATQTLAHSFGTHLGIAYEITASSRTLQATSATAVQHVRASAPVAMALATGHVYSADLISTTTPSVSAAAAATHDIDVRHVALLEELQAALMPPADDSNMISTDRLREIRRLVSSLGGDTRAAAAAATHAQRAQQCLVGLPSSDARDSLARMAAAVGAAM